jgi:SAM-dependent methyltransferase
MVLVDLAPDTQLDAFADGTFDLVWSGQSIEHVSREAAERMVREAFRVLVPKGRFCLDTPIRAVTGLHTFDVGGA